MNKTTVVLTLLLSALVPGLQAQTNLKMGVGTNFLFDLTPNMELSLGFTSELSPNDLEFEMDSALVIQRQVSGQTVTPTFLLPLNLGFNFLYPLSEPKSAKPASLYSFDYFFGVGIAPQMTFSEAFRPISYYGGPFFKTGFRFKAHNYMTIQLQAQEELLFGGPDWITTNTRVGVDMILSLPSAPAGAASTVKK